MLNFLLIFGKFKFKIFLVLFLTFLDTLIVLASPRIISSIVDHGIATNNRQEIMQNGGYLLLFSIFSIIFSVTTTYVAAQIGYGITNFIQKDIFKKLLNFSFKNLDEFSTPTLLTRITNDSDSIGNAIVFTVRMGLQAPIMFIFAIIMSYKISSDLSKIFLVIVPILIIIIMVLFKITSPIFKESQKRIDGINGVIQENIRGIRTVKTYTREEYEISKFMKDNKLLRNVKLKVVYIMTILEPIIGLLINAALIGVLYFGGNLVFSNKLSNGDLIAFISYTSQIFTGLFLMAGLLMTIFPAIISFGRIKEILNTHSEITEKDNAIRKIDSNAKLDLELKNVSYSYSNSKNNTIDNVSLRIPFGTSLGIVGTTGAGKTTLVSLITRLYDVDSGEILLGGHNIKDYTLDALNSYISFVLQKNTLFTGTIRDNMLWGNHNATDEEIKEALRKAEILPLIESYSDNLNHEVLIDGKNFSGGQKQRLTIARAFLKKAGILILDDSTSAVDKITEKNIQNAISTLSKHDITKIIISQRISSVKNCDNIIVLENGKITAQGTHKELISSSLLYQEIYNSQGGDYNEK